MGAREILIPREKAREADAKGRAFLFCYVARPSRPPVLHHAVGGRGWALAPPALTFDMARALAIDWLNRATIARPTRHRRPPLAPGPDQGSREGDGGIMRGGVGGVDEKNANGG